jgi:formyltetrahydrofolate synthetase
MKNTLFDLQNHIFEKIEKLGDDGLQGDEAKIEIAKAMALNELSKSAISNIAMMAKYADDRSLDNDIPVFPETARKRIAEK